jgi:hypothetical protein|tara:strand:- start:25 stop:291 length:267 start_codon:yes stop_codon:yes gene_type:complete
MKPHIKVIQRNGVDIFVTSSMTMKETNSARDGKRLRRLAEESRYPVMQVAYGFSNAAAASLMNPVYLSASRDVNKNFTEHVDSIKSPN